MMTSVLKLQPLTAIIPSNQVRTYPSSTSSLAMCCNKNL